MPQHDPCFYLLPLLSRTGKLVSEYTRRRKKNNPKSVHLVGTDRPEATMIYAGFYHEILAANPLHPLHSTSTTPATCPAPSRATTIPHQNTIP